MSQECKTPKNFRKRQSGERFVKGRKNGQLRTLLGIHDGGEGDTKVGDGTPEIYREKVIKLATGVMVDVPKLGCASQHSKEQAPPSSSLRNSSALH